jgi:hypothetical protein
VRKGLVDELVRADVKVVLKINLPVEANILKVIKPLIALKQEMASLVKTIL